MLVVLDINILISAVITNRGVIRDLFAHWRSGDYDLCLSPEMIEEIVLKLSSPRLSRPYDLSAKDVRSVRKLLLQEAQLVNVPQSAHVRVTGDPEDDHVLASAHQGGAHYLVTGDKALLKLRQHEGVQIVGARTFRSSVRAQVKKDRRQAA